jgi:peptide/nickel transport system substrate-binding protein
MENRFGVKDFILFALLVVLIGVVLLAMQQYDRQWAEVQKIKGRLDDQGQNLRAIQRALARGISVHSGPTTGASASASDYGEQHYPSTNPAYYGKDDPFARQKAARANPDFAEGDWLVDTSEGGIAKLTPFISADLYADRIQSLIFDSLVGLDPMTLEWQPGLATSWKIEDNVAAYEKFVAEQKTAGHSADEVAKDPKLPVPITMTYTVRHDARFSDGSPLTADDVVWTFNWIFNEKVAAPRDRGSLDRVKSVEKQDDDRVVIKFKEPYYDVIATTGSVYILSKKFYEHYTPEQYNQSVGLVMGSGPYRMETPDGWKAGDGQVVLVRNEHFWGVPPAFDRIIYKEMSNDVARQTAFRNGEIDVLESRALQFDAMVKDKTLMARSQAVNVLSLNGGYSFVAWQQKRNGKPTIFADKRVRRAMTMLVDREKIMQQVLLKYAVISTGPFSPVAKQCDPSVKPIPFDPAAGKKLLAEAGLSDPDGSGLLKLPDGTPFRFKLTYPTGSPSVEKIVLTLKDAYAAAGIQMELDPLEWAVFTEKLNHKDFDAITLSWGGGNPEQDPYQMFDSSQAGADGDNFMNYANPDVDTALRKARTTVDAAKRLPLWRKAQRLIYDDQPYMFLWFRNELYLVDGRIKNVQGGPLGLPAPVRTEWYVPRGKQKWEK